jgi:SSS family solute:Na+ symporter
MDNPVTNAAVSAVADAATNAVTAVAAATHTGTVFNNLDWFVIALFGLGMIATVWYSMRKKNESGKDYFLSGRDANWLQIGSSIFSSNIGSEHLVGLAGAGFLTGMAMAHWEMHGWIILVLGWVFVPLYDRMKIFTMPEFLELRFSRGSRNVLSLLTMASLVLTKIAATIYAGDVVIRTLLNVDTVPVPFLGRIDVFWAIALGLAATTGLYTIFGGMRVIMYTAVLQTPVLIFGSVCILFMGLHVLGHGSLAEGWKATLTAVGNNVHLIRPNNDPEWPWLAILPGSAMIGFWYWCTDQYIVQRVLAGKNQQESRRGTILAGFFKLTPVFIFLIPGMIAYALTKTPSAGFSTSGDAAYTSLVAQILPHGLRGMVACGMIVALMASLGSKFNASATLFTMDFYREWYPNASGKTEVLVGRIATAAIVFVGICWVLVIKSLHTNLYLYLQNVQGYLSPAIAVLVRGGRVLETRHGHRGPVVLRRGHDRRFRPAGGRPRHAQRLRNRGQAQTGLLPRRHHLGPIQRRHRPDSGSAQVRPPVRFLEPFLALLLRMAVFVHRCADDRHQPHDQGAGSEDGQVYLLWRHTGGEGRHPRQLECHGRGV